VLSHGAPDGHTLTAVAVARIAEAFELPREAVRADAALAIDWPRSERALHQRLRSEHDWDGSMAAFYVFWLRGNGERS
jgi:hypothetical protein